MLHSGYATLMFALGIAVGLLVAIAIGGTEWDTGRTLSQTVPGPDQSSWPAAETGPDYAATAASYRSTEHSWLSPPTRVPSQAPILTPTPTATPNDYCTGTAEPGITCRVAEPRPTPYRTPFLEDCAKMAELRPGTLCRWTDATRVDGRSRG